MEERMAAMEESKYHVHMKMFTLLVMVAMLYVLTTVHHSDDWHRFFQQAFSAEDSSNIYNAYAAEDNKGHVAEEDQTAHPEEENSDDASFEELMDDNME
ncbi:hypothetical protein AAVH_27329 [Aphelenchoides avenae]|nr:hypothetical protein AAVH_27329 [Aphelenchus avenae]